MKSKSFLFGLSIFLTILSSSSHAVVRYVSTSATGTGDGLSWENAYTDLHVGLAAATSGDELWVAAGNYRTSEAGDRSATFTLKDGVAVYGGFTSGDTDKDNRSFQNGFGGSILSGKTGNSNSAGTFAYHVVTADGVSDSTIVDGFTIQQSYSDGTDADRFGGGIRINNASPMIRNCWISGQSFDGGAGIHITGGSGPVIEDSSIQASNALGLASQGAGILINGASSATITRCTFIGNNAIEGSALYCSSDSSATITGSIFGDGNNGNAGAIYYAGTSGSIENCSFEGSPEYLISGAAITIDGGSLEVVRSTFTRNVNGFINKGGAIYIKNNASPRIYSNCFHGNKATDGGGIYSEDSSPVIVNNVFVGNLATNGAAFYTTGGSPQFVNNSLTQNIASANGGGIYSATGDGEFHNLILWANEGAMGPEVFDNDVSITASYSNIQNGYDPGTNIISADPEFVTNPTPGLDAQWGTIDDEYGDLRLLAGYLEGVGEKSPSIDAGNNDKVPDDFPNLDDDETTAEPTPVDKLDQFRFNDVEIIGDTGLGDNPVVDHGAYETGGQIIHVCPIPGATPPPPPGISVALSIPGANGLVLNSAGLVGNGVGSFGFSSGAGSSWDTPLYDLCTALRIVQPGGEIWIAAGNYYQKISKGGLFISFHLPPDVKVYGGFAGDEASLEDRDLENPAHATIISGATTGETSTYSWGLFDASHGNENSLLCDLTLQDGYANNYSIPDGSSGAGIYCDGGSFTAMRLIFRNFDSDDVGSAVSTRGPGSFFFVSCTFMNSNNTTIYTTNQFDSDIKPTVSLKNITAVNTEANYGPFYYQQGGISTVENTTIEGYKGGSFSSGGGIFLNEILQVRINTVAISNCANEFGNGGAVCIIAGDLPNPASQVEAKYSVRPSIESSLRMDEEGEWCIIEDLDCNDNSSGGNGGALCINGSSSLNSEIKPKAICNNVTINDCSASSGGGMHCTWTDLTATNCNFERNSATGNGGGLNLTSTIASLTSCTLDGNHSNFYGGGLFMKQSTVTGDSCLYRNNSSDQTGSAVACQQTDWDEYYGIITCNQKRTAVEIFDAESKVYWENVTCVNNNNTFPGSGGVNLWGTGIFDSCIIRHNTGDVLEPSENDVKISGSGSATFAYCIVGGEEPQPGIGNKSGPTSSLNLPVDFCSEGHDLTLLRPSESSVAADCGNPLLESRLDFFGTQTGDRRAIGASEHSDFDEPTDNPGVKEPSWIIVEDVIQTDVGKEVPIQFRIGDPDYSEHPEGLLKLTLHVTEGEIQEYFFWDGLPQKGQKGKTVEITRGEGFLVFEFSYIPQKYGTKNDTLTISLSDQGYSLNKQKQEEELIAIATVEIQINKTDTDEWRADLVDKLSPEQLLEGAAEWGSDPNYNGYNNAMECHGGWAPLEVTQSSHTSISRGVIVRETYADYIERVSQDAGQAQIGGSVKNGNSEISYVAPEKRSDSDKLYFILRRSKLTGINAWVEISNGLDLWAPILDIYSLPTGPSEIVEVGDSYEIVQVDLTQMGIPDLYPTYYRIIVEIPE